MAKKRTEKAEADIRRLAELFPAAIREEPAERVPLKLGIDQDILAAGAGINRWRICNALRLYTAHRAYGEAVAAGGVRYGLGGNIAGPISEKHRLRARMELLQPVRRPLLTLKSTPASVRL